MSDVNSSWITYLPSFVFSRLDGRPDAQKVLANAGWLFADRVIRLAVGVGVGVWVTRFLGPERFGLLGYALAFVSLLGTLGALGLDGIVVRELVRDPERKDETLGAAFTAKLVGGVTTVLLAIVVIRLLRPDDSTLHLVVGILALGTVFQSLDAIDFWFQSRVESRFGVYAKSTAFLFIAAVKVAFIIFDAPLIMFAVAATLEIAIGAVGLAVAYRMTGQRLLTWKLRAESVKELIRSSWPLALASTAVMVSMKVDQIMLGQMVGNREVGLYGAALRFSEVWYVIPVSIVASVAPSLTNARKSNIELYYARLGKLFRLLVAIAFAIAIPMTFFAGYLTRVVYGQNYLGAGQILSIHIWAVPFVFLGVAQTIWTLNEGTTGLALFRTVSGAVANVALNLALIPSYGAAGAAIATTLSYALSAVILNAFSSKTRPIFVLQLKSMLMMAGKR